MAAGAGNSAAGLSVAGFGDLDQAGIVTSDFLPNPQTGNVMDAPLITGGNNAFDLNYTSIGVLQGMSSVDQQVLLAVGTVKGTAIVPTVGSEIESILQYNSLNVVANVTNEIELCLNQLIKAGSITLDHISVIQDPNVNGRLNIQVFYTNLKLNVKRTLSL